MKRQYPFKPGRGKSARQRKKRRKNKPAMDAAKQLRQSNQQAIKATQKKNLWSAKLRSSRKSHLTIKFYALLSIQKQFNMREKRDQGTRQQKKSKKK